MLSKHSITELHARLTFSLWEYRGLKPGHHAYEALTEQVSVLFKNKQFYVYKYFACMSLCLTYMPGTYKGQKRLWNPLELELQMAVSCHVGAGY